MAKSSETDNAYSLFSKILKFATAKDIAEHIGLSANTIKRWSENRSVPWQYHGDFLRMLDEDGLIDVSGCSFKDRDQFYTDRDVADRCWQTMQHQTSAANMDMSDYVFVDPSAGDGSFYDLMPEARRIGLDIDPHRSREKEILKTDFLRWLPDMKTQFAVVGNPPFGLRGHLALQFINHAARFADVVAFILPQLFGSDGKGVPRKRVDSRLALMFSEPLPSESFRYPDGTKLSISTVFQIWVPSDVSGITRPALNKTCKSWIQVYSLSDGGTPSTTRNKKMIGRCDVYLPSTGFSGMKAYGSFEELPNRRGYGIKILRNVEQIKALLESHDWSSTAFKSANGTSNLRKSLIEQVVCDAGFSDT